MDVISPFPRTERGKHYVLAALDYFTKWPDKFAIPDQETETIADALVEGVFRWFGAAVTLKTAENRTTPLHPQINSLVERFNRTLAHTTRCSNCRPLA